MYPSGRKQTERFARKKVLSKKKMNSYVTKSDFESQTESEDSSSEESSQEVVSTPYHTHHPNSKGKQYVRKNFNNQPKFEINSEQSSLSLQPVPEQRKSRKVKHKRKIARSEYQKYNAIASKDSNFVLQPTASHLKGKKKRNQMVAIKDSGLSESVSNCSGQLKDDCMSGLSIEDMTSVPLSKKMMKKGHGKKSSGVRKAKKKPAISSGRKKRLPKIRNMVMSAVKSYPGQKGISLSSIMKYMVARYDYEKNNIFVVQQTVNWLIAKKVLRFTSSGRLKLTGFKLVLLPKGKGNSSKKKKLMKSISDYQRKIRARAYSRRHAKQRRLKQKILKSMPLVYKQRHSCIQEGICRFCARKLKKLNNDKAIYWIPAHSRGPPQQPTGSSSISSQIEKESITQELAYHQAMTDSEDVGRSNKKKIKWVPDLEKEPDFDSVSATTE